MPRRKFLTKLTRTGQAKQAKQPEQTHRTHRTLTKLTQRHPYSNRFTYDQLINAESAIGRTLFGTIPEGHQREFFTSRKNVWIWHESWTDKSGSPQEITVRYEVRPNGVYKRANKGNYELIVGDELDNFRQAARSYLSLVKSKLYC